MRGERRREGGERGGGREGERENGAVKRELCES